MEPVTVILATFLAAAAADRSRSAESEKRKGGGLPVIDDDTFEALEMLSEDWPADAAEPEFAWMDLMGAYNHAVVPWTPAQVSSFKRGVLMCPMGHTDEERMSCLELQISIDPLRRDPSGQYVADSKNRSDIHWHNHGLVICNHPDHTDADRTFWFPRAVLNLRKS